MINDSTNVRVIADNIKKLEKMVKEAGSELPTPGAGDTGKILKVGSDGYELATEYSYTPPAYSDTVDVDSGRKWIDGKTIYERVYTGMTGETGTGLMTNRSDISSIVSIDSHMVNTFGAILDMNVALNPRYVAGTGIVYTNSASYPNFPYYALLCFTKTDPTPEPTTSTKKTTKKG